MKDPTYLIIHKDHPVMVRGVNSGAEMATLYLAKFLVKAGKRVVFCAELAEGDDEINGVACWNLGPEYDVRGALEKARKFGNYHLISSGRAHALLESRGDEQCLSRTLMVHDPSGNSTGINSKILVRIADNIVCVSEAQKNRCIEAGIEGHRITVIKNGADLELFTSGDPEKRNYRRLIFVGALVQDKGIHFLLEAYAKLKGKFQDLSLDVYGSAALWGREPLFDERQMERQLPGVKFHGNVPQTVVAEAYRNAGACIIPSIWFDSFPLTAVEAQVCGCPVVAFDVGGLKEAVLSGRTGMVISEITPAALTNTLDQLISSPDKLRAMSIQAQLLARESYNWETVAKSVIKLCDSRILRSSGSGEDMDEKKYTLKKLGFLTTWNQECGLATYARYLTQELSKDSVVILAEQTSAASHHLDENNVERCWSRGSGNYERLLAAIKKHDIGLLHLNCQARFFKQPQFSELLRKLKTEGVKIIVHAHSLFTIEQASKELFGVSDAVIVHTAESKLEAIANGAEPKSVHVVPHGVALNEKLRSADRRLLRARQNIPLDQKVITAFGFIQPHKGMEGVIESVSHLRCLGIAAKGYIIGKPHAEDPNGTLYLAQLKELAQLRGVATHVEFIEGFADEDKVTEYLAASDVVLMNYRSDYYEASGACAVALGAGALVATSTAPSFSTFGGAVWHMTSGYPAPIAVEALISNKALRDTVLAAAARYCDQNSWSKISKYFLEVYRQLGFVPAASVKEIAVENKTSEQARRLSRTIKVLMQNRPTTFTQRGGDTIVMEKTIEALKGSRVEITVDVQGMHDPASFDLVHLFNFALPDLTRAYAEKAVSAGVPYVVTTLCEDIPSFHNQSHAVANRLMEYVQLEQPRGWYRSHAIDMQSIERCARFDNSWTVSHAAALLSSGASETEVLRRDYPSVKCIEEVSFGCEMPGRGDSELFFKKFGERDFVLCVARFESRKNQLMLLKALERSDLTLVFASGGFSYQPQYADAVMRFKRKGKTLILDRLTPEMLASAYCCARVHALPSWYELPGLVSLEAALYGCNIVASDRGTTRDYLGEDAFYCDPSSADSILNAVTAAYHTPKSDVLKGIAGKYTWALTAQRTLNVYEEVLLRSGVRRQSAQESTSVIVPALPTTLPQQAASAMNAAELPADFQEVLASGEKAAKERDYPRAHELLERASKMNPSSVRALRAQGAVYFAEGNVIHAEKLFDCALAIDPMDAKTLAGKGMCRVNQKQPGAAYPYLIKALEIAPDELVTILQLVECAYQLGKFSDLERVLRGYTQRHPNDVEMRFCLAGCLFKQSQFTEAMSLTESVLSVKPQHLGANQLKGIINETSAGKAEAAPISPQTEQAVAPQPWRLPKTAPIDSAGVASKTESVATSFDTTDQELVQLEEQKRLKKLKEAREGCEAILLRHGITQQQRERAELIKAEAMVLSGELQGAEAIYDSILSRRDSCARAICGKGALAANRNEWEAAKNFFELARAVEPKYDVALAGLGLCALWVKDNEPAWEYFTMALEINPENTRALLGVIELGYQNKRFRKVQEVLEKYLDMHPGDLNFAYALAGCFFVQDKYEEAMDLIKRITLFEPQHQNALDLKRMIEEKRHGIGVAAHQ